MRFVVEYGSNSQRTDTIESDSRDAKRHGQNLLGSAGNGFVRVKDKSGKVVSYARYSPENGGKWYNAFIGS